VELARQRGGYDELVVAELTAFLRQRERSFDVVVSADTLVYFGDLAEVLAAAATALRPQGGLVFTLERAEPGQADKGYQLRPSGRYCHTREYVEVMLRQAGFIDPVITEIASRKEVERWVPGWLVCGRLPPRE
jgi:predicted TPR repeat methyltransferase